MKIKFLMISLVFFSISASAQKKAIEKKTIDTIFNLKEVKQRAIFIEKESRGKRHLGVAVYTNPTKDEPYYWVKVWEDNGESYVTHFNFYVYPKPFTIKFYDADNDSAINLKDWRQQAKH